MHLVSRGEATVKPFRALYLWLLQNSPAHTEASVCMCACVHVCACPPTPGCFEPSEGERCLPLVRSHSMSLSHGAEMSGCGASILWRLII